MSAQLAAIGQLRKLHSVQAMTDDELLDRFEQSSVDVRDFWDDPETSAVDDRMHHRLRDELYRRLRRAAKERAR